MKNSKTIFIYGLTFILINILISFLPDGPYMSYYKNSLQLASKADEEIDIILFGDSRATMFNHEFFERNTLSFAIENNSILFSEKLYEDITNQTDINPKVIIICLGANNYSKNSIFAKRDFAIRRLYPISYTLNLLFDYESISYSSELFFSRIVPMYGRRMEIRSPNIIKRILKNHYKSSIPTGMIDMKDGWEHLKPNRNIIADKNYLLTYERSIYRNFQLSNLHTAKLEQLIDVGIQNGSKIVLIQLPIEKEMMTLQRNMIGDKFDNYLMSLKSRKKLFLLDLRNYREYEFNDLNHLSPRGAKSLLDDIINPFIENIIKSHN